MKESMLFRNFSDEELDNILKCMGCQIKQYKKDQMIIQSGEEISDIGLILSGSVLITKDDFWGNRAILSKLSDGQIFGETFAILRNQKTTVNAICEQNCEVVFLKIERMLTVCSNGCDFHNKLISNLTLLLAKKNLMLTSKIEHLTKRTTREKLLSYLSECSINLGTEAFEIPYNRQQLADFLCVERSAMSSELSKLKKEGIINFDKQKFHLIKPNY